MEEQVFYSMIWAEMTANIEIWPNWEKMFNLERRYSGKSSIICHDILGKTII